ncbi:radical SAM protein [bacterium]|nr:radical SAM protein [bacterium]
MENEVKKEIHRNQIKFMQWDITKHCNLRCKHCRSVDYYDGKKGEAITDLTKEEVFRVMDDISKNGVNRIHFLGGEPFIREDLLEIIRYGNSKGIISSVNTNGTLLTPEIIDEIMRSKVYLLTFSLDGASKETNDFIRGEGVFEKVCNNIRLVDKTRKQKKQFLRIITSPVITKVNHHEAENFVYLAKELGLDSIIFTTLRKKGRAKENIEDLGLTIQEEMDFAEKIAKLIQNKVKQHIQIGIGSPLFSEYLNLKYNIKLPILPGGCNSLKLKGFIHPDGSLFPCQEITEFYVLNDEKKSVSRERITEKGFKKIWESNNYIELFKLMFNTDIKNRNTPCNKCKYFFSFCYPCPLPALRNSTAVNNHPLCIETLKRASQDNIELKLDSDINIDSQSIIHKAVNEPDFRNELVFSYRDAINKNRFVISEEEQEKINKILKDVENKINKNLNIK